MAKNKRILNVHHCDKCNTGGHDDNHVTRFKFKGELVTVCNTCIREHEDASSQR